VDDIFVATEVSQPEMVSTDIEQEGSPTLNMQAPQQQPTHNTLVAVFTHQARVDSWVMCQIEERARTLYLAAVDLSSLVTIGFAIKLDLSSGFC
jgi:hypothetical protein